jgi:iron complex outermembrane receptor protein
VVGNGLNALAPNYDQNFSVPAFTSDANITAAQTGVYLQDQIKLDRPLTSGSNASL